MAILISLKNAKAPLLIDWAKLENENDFVKSVFLKHTIENVEVSWGVILSSNPYQDIGVIGGDASLKMDLNRTIDRLKHNRFLDTHIETAGLDDSFKDSALLFMGMLSKNAYTLSPEDALKYIKTFDNFNVFFAYKNDCVNAGNLPNFKVTSGKLVANDVSFLKENSNTGVSTFVVGQTLAWFEEQAFKKSGYFKREKYEISDKLTYSTFNDELQDRVFFNHVGNKDWNLLKNFINHNLKMAAENPREIVDLAFRIERIESYLLANDLSNKIKP